MQNVLFNPEYKDDFSKIKQFSMGRPSDQANFGPNSANFQALTEIYSWNAKDLKSYIGTHKASVISHITTLLEQNLIFPYILLKNLDFQDKIYIILPDTKGSIDQTILKIFNFFNYGFIYEIEGEFYIHGFSDQKKFENGLMIKLYFPQCEIHEFLRLFDFLFEYLEIDNYIILTDLANGKSLLKEIYGSLDFLDSYNPLVNLKWNDRDKIWLNHKLFTEKFEKLYPDLFYG